MPAPDPRAEGRTAFRFSVVGVLNTAVDYGVFALLSTLGAWPPAGAHTASVAAATVHSYLWNRNWTFRARTAGAAAEAARVLRFVVLNLASFGASLGAVVFLTSGVLWHPLAAKGLAIVVSMTVNYLGNRFWVFRGAGPVPPRGSPGTPGPGTADGS